MHAKLLELSRGLGSAGAALLCVVAVALGAPASRAATGYWTPLGTAAPEGIGTMLLMTDGTVMCQGSGTSANWYTLAPDSTGSYVNGSWTNLPSMNVARQFYGSAVLPSGDVVIAGGEYSGPSGAQNENNTIEGFDPIAGLTWNFLPQPTVLNSNPPVVWTQIGDASSCVLANGNLLIGNSNDNESAIYDELTNTWSSGGSLNDVSAEESWVLLPGGDVITIDCIGQAANGPNAAEMYNPATNTWIPQGSTPAGHNVVEASSAEIGPAVLMPSGTVLFVGATGHTAQYNSATTLWSAGADLPTVVDVDSGDQGSGTSNTYNTTVQAQCKDAPGCLETNGDVLVCAGATGYNNNKGGNQGYPNGQYFFEYTPGSTGSPGTWASVPFPTGSIQLIPPFQGRLLALPSGQILFSNYQSQLYIYTPNGGPKASWAPTIAGFGINPNATYTANGTQFNGMSQASMYGDDSGTATNYPLVQLSAGGGQYYGRTFGHSTMGVQTGSAPVSTNFIVSPYMPSGEYNLAIDANGIPSAPVTFHTGIFVNAAWSGPEFGTAMEPFVTATQGVDAAPGSSDVPSASYIFIDGGNYSDKLTISTPCTLINNGGGPVTIGL